MSLGKTWWHGAIVKRQDSYGPEERVFKARFDEQAWEATAAWEAKRGPLAREANALLQGKWDKRLREFVVSEDAPSEPSAPKMDEDLFIALLAVILSGE